MDKSISVRTGCTLSVLMDFHPTRFPCILEYHKGVPWGLYSFSYTQKTFQMLQLSRLNTNLWMTQSLLPPSQMG